MPRLHILASRRVGAGILASRRVGAGTLASRRVGAGILAVSTALALASPRTAHANGVDTNGFMSRSIALGGAVSADVQDPSANYYNPAGIVRGEGLRLMLGYSDVQSQLWINGVDSNVERMAGLDFGLTAPVKLGSVDLGFGLGLHLPDQRLSRTRSSLVDRPRWELFDTRPHKVFISAILGVRLTRWLLLGAGITFQSPSVLELNIRGEADALQPERRSHLEHEFRGDLTSIRYPDAGMQLLLPEGVSVGVTYRGAFELKNTIRATVDGDITGLGDPIPLAFTLESISVSTYVPQQVDMGLAWRPEFWPRLRVGFDLVWIDWSKHSSLIPTEDIVLTLDPPPGLGINVPSEIVGRRPIAMNLKDRFVPRVGIELRALDEARYALDLRAGYVYERTPFPAQTAVTNFIDSTRHQVSVGAGITLRGLEPVLRGGIRLDAHFSYMRVMERQHVKDSLVDPVGDYVAGGHQFGAGVAAEIAFE